MIRTSRLAAVFCGLAALGLHGAGLWVSETPVPIEIEGGGDELEASLGSSFADMAAGSVRPVEADTTATQPDATEPDKPPEPDRTPPTQSAVTEAVTTTRDATPAAPTADATPTKPQEAPASTSAQVTEAVEAKQATASPPAPAAPAPSAAEAVTAAPSANALTATPSEIGSAEATEPDRVEATPRSEQAVETSLRPKSRPRTVERAATRQETAPKPKRSASSQAGNNATRDARRGSTTGRETTSAAQTTGQNRTRSAAEGNASASNYPGQVMRHLARVPRPRSQGRGAAIVQFSIAQNGRLSSVGLARSSGSDRLDRAALTVVQRAAPFPAPPSGATRSFSVKIEGR